MNFNYVCRTCLTTEELKPIFVESVDDKLHSTAIFVTTGIKVNKDDGLPQQMCARCISFSNASLKFRKQCRDAETRLLQVKQECDGAAEALDSGAADSEDLHDKDMWLELKPEVHCKIDYGDVTIKSEVLNEVQDNGIGNYNYSAPNTTEEELFELKPAGGAGAELELPYPSDLKQNTGKKPRPHVCDVCSKEFSQKHHLVRHRRKLHKDGIDNTTNEYTCDICAKWFTCRWQLSNHIRIHTRENLFSCDECKKQFVSKSNLTRHIRMHTGEKPFRCDVCKMQFTNSSHLNRHRLVHTGVKPYACSVCNKHFARNTHLTSHMRTHTREKPFTCDVCKKQFSDGSNLTTHKLTHTGERPHPCGVCIKQFTQKSSLARHMNTHTAAACQDYGDVNIKSEAENEVQDHGFGNYSALNTTEEELFELKPAGGAEAELELTYPSDVKQNTGKKPRPHVCDVCSKEFSQKQNLIRHRRKLHKNDIDKTTNEYICDICAKRFSCRWLLTNHIRIHTRENLFSCDECKKEFVSRSNFTRHIRMHTGEKPFRCDVCKMQFTNRSHLNRHGLIHTGVKPYACSVCNKHFARNTHLTSHMRTHSGEKPFTCDVCQKQFSDSSILSTHKLTHTGERPHHCGVCKKQFTQKSSLARHMNTHTGTGVSSNKTRRNVKEQIVAAEVFLKPESSDAAACQGRDLYL